MTLSLHPIQLTQNRLKTNIRFETEKLLEENIVGKIVDTGLVNELLNMTLKGQQKQTVTTGTTETKNASAQQESKSIKWKGNLWNENTVSASPKSLRN